MYLHHHNSRHCCQNIDVERRFSVDIWKRRIVCRYMDTKYINVYTNMAILGFYIALHLHKEISALDIVSFKPLAYNIDIN